MGTSTPRRMHIVGGPGSGKTTLAARLGQQFRVPVYDLDAIAYEGGAGGKREPGIRRADVERIAQTPGWVTEGIYLWWCGPLAERADRIVWLDVPWRVAVYRMVRRHIRLSLAGTNRHPGLAKLARFAWGTRRYYLTDAWNARSPGDEGDDGAITRAATEVWLEPYGDKVIRCRAVSDLEQVMAPAAGQRTAATADVLGRAAPGGFGGCSGSPMAQWPDERSEGALGLSGEDRGG